MRKLPLTVVVAVALLLAAAVLAEEVVLKDGTSGHGEILETTKDGVKVQIDAEGGGTATLPLQADQLDPHCFYELRSRHMESTVENHLDLARFCVQHELFSRAQAQVALARKIDSALVDTVITPEVKEGLAGKLLQYAREQMEEGSLAEAEKWVALVLAKVPGTKAAEDATRLLDQLEEEEASREAAAAQAKAESVRAQADEKVKAAYEKRLAQLDPVRKLMDEAEAMGSAGLRQKNGGNAKKMLEGSAERFQACIAECEKLLGKADATDTEIGASLNDMIVECQSEAVKALVNAGRIEMAQGAYVEASKYGRMALAIDGDSAQAQRFLADTAAAAALAGTTSRRR